MKLADLQGTPLSVIEQQVQQGARFVAYEYCISVIVLSVRRSSAVHYLRPDDGALMPGLRYSLLTLLAGWWGIPWGPLWTIRAVLVNFGGGQDITQEMMGYFRGEAPPPLGARVRCQRCGYDSSRHRYTCKNCRAPLP
jgi:hypothetical protein